MTRYAEVRWADVRHARCLHTQVSKQNSSVHINDQESAPYWKKLPSDSCRHIIAGVCGEVAAYMQWSRLSLSH